MELIAGLRVVPRPDGAGLRDIFHLAGTLELRADLTGDLDASWLRDRFGGRLLYSLRSIAAGGSFQGDLLERSSRLKEAARGFDFVELETSDLRPEVLPLVPPGKRLISWYGASPAVAQLKAGLDRMCATAAPYYKIVVAARSHAQELAPLQLLKSLSRRDVVAFAEGQSGLWTRILAPLLGSPLIFGAAGELSAGPGEIPVRRLAEDFGFPIAAGAREIFGIVGSPVNHSLSPRVHNAAYKAVGRPALFLPFHVEDFEEFWSNVVNGEVLADLGMPINGLTVASPHKEAATGLQMPRTSMVNRARSTNLFVRGESDWKACTTDPDSLAPAFPSAALSGKRAAVVGCGGAGRAIAAALHDAGADVTLVNRTPGRGMMAARLLKLPYVPLSDFSVEGFSVVVNATPVGRDDNQLPFALEGLGVSATVIDLVYGAGQSPLVAGAERMARRAIDGRRVLLAQARKQFELMTGTAMPESVAEHAVQCLEAAGAAAV